MKKLLIIWFLAVVGVVFVMGCTQKRNKFPEKIGNYSMLKVKDMPQFLCKEKGMESFTHVTYSGYQGWAFVNLILYRSEEAARVDYNAGGKQGYKESEIGVLSGMYKTSFSHNTFNITFGWNEGKTNKFVNIAKQKQVDENIDDIEKECRKGLLIFIKAFKEL